MLTSGNTGQRKNLLRYIFIFNEKLYTQVDGVSMGSCLGPSFANAFMCHHEEKWLDDCPESFKPLYYRRYVDDTFLIFEQASHAPEFLAYLNSKHNNIKFTSENEVDGSISFLDVKVTREGENFNTSIFRKPTSTGLGTHYLSFIPSLFKINAVKTLIHRCHTISSNWLNFDKEIKFLKIFFMNNGYPVSVFESAVSRYLDEKFEPKPNASEQKLSTKYIKLPFYGHLSYVLRNKLKRVCKEFFPTIKVKFIFTNTFTIKSFFKVKDSVPVELASNVVYEFSCLSCNARYIGETSRNLSHRYAEHRGVSVRTGRSLASPPFSAIRMHAIDTDHNFSINNFKILDKGNNTMDIKLLEALHIKYKSPELNGKFGSNHLMIEG